MQTALRDEEGPIHGTTLELDGVCSGRDWSYAMRRTAQSILPYLYLGPNEASRDLALLHSFNITAIVVLRTQQEAPFLKPRFPQSFAYHVLELSDRDDQNLITLVPQFRAFIDHTVRQGGRVLIHDDRGVSRAPAMVILYLIDQYGISFERAATHVQNRRYCVHLNQGFVQQCTAFEPMCRARALVSNSSDVSATTDVPSRKRSGADRSAIAEEEMARGGKHAQHDR